MAHEHDDYGWGHHDARYNLDKIINNLLLIQDHYTFDPCADCLTKHHKLVMAYAEEGMTLDNNDMVRRELSDAEELSRKHLHIVVECTIGNKCKVKKPEDMQRMVQEVRALRRKLNMKVYGLEGDITHDILVDDHSHYRDLDKYVHE